jgi:hypothetical protein
MVNEINDRASESVNALANAYNGLAWSDHGVLSGGEEYLFISMCGDDVVVPPSTLPSISHEARTYFLVPGDINMPNYIENSASPRLKEDVAREGVAFIPTANVDWLDDDKVDGEKIIKAIREHNSKSYDARYKREAKELLKRERRKSDSSLYASAANIDQESPMLIDGLMRERGVSVIYGAFDEFKTTLVLDMMAHVAMGTPWQGREVKPRPVIWYALEGKDEIPVRLRALEASMKGKDTAWGDDLTPLTVLDRIPEDYGEWREEICRTMNRWEEVNYARNTINDFKMTKRDGKPLYPVMLNGEHTDNPVIVIDTLSMALGGEDEKGPRAAGFIHDCLDLLKKNFNCGNPYDWGENDKSEKWYEEHPGTNNIEFPVASHVIIIHHQTKTGTDFAGHRAIAANTQGLYRVHRFGNISDADRPYAGQLTPQRVKGIPRPAPIRFEVDVVSVEGTKQTAAILKDKAATVPKKLMPVIEALRELHSHDAISRDEVNGCIDVIANNRTTRNRHLKELETAGVLEASEDENGKVLSYRFNDTGTV